MSNTSVFLLPLAAWFCMMRNIFRMLCSLGLWAFQGKGHHASQWDIPGKEDGEEVFGLPR